MVSFHRTAEVAADPATDMAAVPVGALSAAAYPRVNLMPDIVGVEARTRRARMIAIGVIGGSVVVVAGLLLAANSNVATSQDELDAVQARSATLASEAAKYADVPKVQAQVKDMQANVYSALGGEVRWASLLTNLALTMPAGTSLTSFTGTVNPNPPAVASATGKTPAAVSAAGQNQPFVSVLGNPGIGTITYAGEALGYPQVSAFLESQAKQKTLLDPYANSVIAAEPGSTSAGKGVTFSSSSTVTAAALSHRYDKLAGS